MVGKISQNQFFDLNEILKIRPLIPIEIKTHFSVINFMKYWNRTTLKRFVCSLNRELIYQALFYLIYQDYCQWARQIVFNQVKRFQRNYFFHFLVSCLYFEGHLAEWSQSLVWYLFQSKLRSPIFIFLFVNTCFRWNYRWILSFLPFKNSTEKNLLCF